MRAHPAVKDLGGVEYNDTVIDVSAYPDMVDLLLIADVLITDYSSCAGDFVLQNRALILYQSDRMEYLKNDRTLYFEMEDSPFWVAQSQTEIEKIIEQMDNTSIHANCKAILDFYKTTESGHSAQEIVNVIMQWIYNDKDRV